MNIEYTDKMTGKEYNEMRELVGWTLITEGQADRGIQNTTFLVAAREKVERNSLSTINSMSAKADMGCKSENTDSFGKIIGMGRVLFDFGYTAYLGDIIVSPDYQGKGVGKTIVEMLMSKVMAAAEHEDKIMFMIGAAKGKEAFYEKMGFEVRPSETYGPGMTKWVKVSQSIDNKGERI